MAADGVVEYSINIETNNAQMSGAKLTKVLKTTAKAVTALGITAAGIATKLALDLEGTSTKYNAVFKGITDGMDQFIMEFQKLSPVTVAEGRKLASGVQDMLVPLGIAREEAGELTKEFLHTAGALASFNDELPQDTILAFQSALSGSFEPLKRYGIQLNVNKVNQEAVRLGLAESTKTVSDAAKAQVILKLANEQSSDALGAFTEANLNFREKFNLALRDLKDAGAELGKIFLPAVALASKIIKNDVVPAVKSFNDFIQNNSDLLIAAGVVLGSLVLALKVYSIQQALATSAVILWGAQGAIATAITTGFGAAMAFLTSPITLVIIAIGLLTAAGILMYRNWDKVKSNLLSIWDIIKASAYILKDNVVLAFQKIKESILQDVMTIMEQAQPLISFLPESIQESFSNASSGITESLEEVRNKMSNTSDSIAENKKLISDSVNNMKTDFSNLGEGTSKLVDKIKNYKKQNTETKPAVDMVTQSVKAQTLAQEAQAKSVGKSTMAFKKQKEELTGIQKIMQKGISGSSSKSIVGYYRAQFENRKFKASASQNTKADKSLMGLANGGIAYDETVVKVGDNKMSRTDPEVIAPLSKLENIMSGKTRSMNIENINIQNPINSTAEEVVDMINEKLGRMI